MTFPLARHRPLIQNESKTSNHHQSAYPASADMRYVKTAAYCASRGCIQYMFALQDRVHDDPWRRDATRTQPESVILVTHNFRKCLSRDREHASCVWEENSSSRRREVIRRRYTACKMPQQATYLQVMMNTMFNLLPAWQHSVSTRMLPLTGLDHTAT